MILVLLVLAVVNLLATAAVLHAVSHLGHRHVEIADKVDQVHTRVSHAIATRATPLHGPTGPVR